MATAVNAAATRKAAYDATKEGKIEALTTSEYTMAQFRKLKRSLLTRAMAVPTQLGGGQFGHAYLVCSDAELQELANNPGLVQAEVVHPGDVAAIQNGDSHATIALRTQELAAARDQYFTQEGVKAALRDLIIENVPVVCIRDQREENFGYTRRTPRQLLDHLLTRAEVVSIETLGEMIQQRDRAYDLEGEETLKAFFEDIDKHIRQLNSQNVTTSESTLMVSYLAKFELGGNILREAVQTWNARPAGERTWANFKTHFEAADKLRRRVDKASGGRAAQANHTATQPDSESMMALFAAAMENFASSAEESINAAIESKFKEREDNSASDKQLARIKDLERQLAAAKKNGGGGTNDGGGGGGGSNKKHPKCSKCGGHHKQQADGECWKANRDAAPEWWKKRNPE